MPNHGCERCGGTTSVTVATVRPNHGGERPPPSEHRYCRECARMTGVPVPARGDTPAVITEPAAPTWSHIENHLAQYEGVLRDEPSVRDHVLSMARQLLRLARRMPGRMLDAVAAAFTRMGVSETPRNC